MENILEIIQCSICADTFSEPKVLPCVHTFCLKCLKTLNDEAKQPEKKLSCPLCRNECVIPDGGLSHLPNNYFVQKLLEIENITAVSSKIALCESCDRDEGNEGDNSSVCEASVYCLECQQHFCTQCHKAHDKMRFNKSHKVIKPGSLNLKSDGLMKMTLSFCDRHTDEPVKHYCMDCEIVICLSCYVEDHSTHKCSSIGKEAEQARLQMREDVASVQQQSEKLLKVSKEIEVEKKALVDEINGKKEAVRQRLVEVKERNEKEAEALENELNCVKQLKMKELESAKELNKRHQLMMDSFTRYVQEVISQATDAEILRCASTMRTRAADLKAVHTPSDFSAVKIEFRTNSGIVGNLKSIKSNSFVSNPLFLHTDTLRTPDKIPINQIQRMTTLEDELYILTPTVKTNLCFQQILFYMVLPPNISQYFPQQWNGWHPQPPAYTHLLACVHPTYSESPETLLLKLTFSNIQPCAVHNPQLDAKFEIPENTITIPYNETDEEIDNHIIDIHAANGTAYLTLDVQITYRASSITVTASNVRVSTGTVAPMSVDISKEIPGMYSTLQLKVYNSLTYRQQRQMNVYVLTKTYVEVTDMTSCSYYNCIYISDRANSLIHRLGQLGSSSQLKLEEPPTGLSVTKQHTLLVTCLTNTIIVELSTDGTVIRKISLSSFTNPRRGIRLEGEQYLVTGSRSNTDSIKSNIFVVDANGIGLQELSIPVLELIDVALDKHDCFFILTTNNTIQIRNGGREQKWCDIKEVSLSDYSLAGCDQMHFDAVHGRLYLAKTNTPGLTVFKIE